MSYLLWANVYLAVFYGFYWFFLRKETFFNLNRWYFLCSAMLSFTIPLLDLNLFSFETSPELFAMTLPEVQINGMADLSNSFSWLFYIYLIGCSAAFVWFLYKILLIKRNLKTNNSGDACSFLHLIKVDPRLTGHDKIIAHEHIHVKQLHSLDILIFEIIRIFNWFNPIVYLLIRSVKLNHEYIADEETACLENERIDYANLLVSQAFSTNSYSLRNNFFNKPFLKNRIAMLFKNKSKKSVLLRFSLLIPIMLVAFAFQAEKETEINVPASKDEAASKISTVLHADTSAVFTAVEVPPVPEGGMQGFYQYIGDNFVYPKEAVEAKVQGRMLTQFIVEKDGSLSNIKILRDLGYGTGEAAVKMLENCPKWKPAIQNGMNVRVQFTLPIQLNQRAEEDSKDAAPSESTPNANTENNPV